MSNHWESSARPLFVKTVFVNGNRHAILFEKDPLLRCGSLPFKKISRSNSSVSFASDLSVTSSESQDSNLDGRVSKLRNRNPRQQRDLSSELQNCLIKLQLASNNFENGSKSDGEKCLCNSKEAKKIQREIFKQKRHNWNREKSCRRKHCTSFQDEFKKKKLTDHESNKNSSCYFYNCESNRRKKNYCVVRITSNTSQFNLSCRCEANLKKTHNCKGFLPCKNNMVISATIHNLLMPSRKEKVSDNDLFLRDNYDSFDLYWNNYLTRSYYNSLAERVLQWLDLTSKKKTQREKLVSGMEDDPTNNFERIYSGKTFASEINKTEFGVKFENKSRIKTLAKKERENLRDETPEKEVEAEVTGEANIETVLSAEELQGEFRECFEKEITMPFPETGRQYELATTSIPVKTNTNYFSEVILKRYTVQQLNTQIPAKSPLLIQDLLMNCQLRKNFNFPSEENSRQEIPNPSANQNNPSEVIREGDKKEENVILTHFNTWEIGINKESHKFDPNNEQTPYKSGRNSDECSNKLKNQILTEEFSKRHQKSINNINITQARPVSMQTSLSPKEHNKITSLQKEKIIWASEKDTGRPQLHIFMPSIFHFSEDSTSECENFLNLR